MVPTGVKESSWGLVGGRYMGRNGGLLLYRREWEGERKKEKGEGGGEKEEGSWRKRLPRNLLCV